MPSPARAAHRKLSDYCGIFAEKTNKIGRNVESFMQSRGLLPIRRSVDETTPPRRDPIGINGDVIANDLPRIDRETRENHRRRDCDYEDRSYEQPCRSNAPKKRVMYFNNSTYPRDTRSNVNYVHRSNETEPRRSRRREYAEADYGAVDIWTRDSLAARGPSFSKPILRNGINHDGDERLYYSTLPRRSRTINFQDQARGSSEGRRPYPKSLLDLTDLELDDVARLVSPRGRIGYREETLDDYQQRGRNHRETDESLFEDDYLKLCRNLSSLDRYPRGGGRYEPGQVHYERECRTFGKDTVAFIYYKTCYL